jgi:hypothetical protein
MIFEWDPEKSDANLLEQGPDPADHLCPEEQQT